ncbi:MAG: hypothetical protein ACQR33_02520 [Candidatus Saccharibacteria bacterium]
MEYEPYIDYATVTPFQTGNFRHSDERVPASFERDESLANNRALEASADNWTRRNELQMHYTQAAQEAERRGEETNELIRCQRIARSIMRATTGYETLVTRAIFDDIVRTNLVN